MTKEEDIQKQKIKFVYLKATVNSIYMFEKGKINGWDTRQVIEEWFTSHNLTSPHATRDAHEIRGYRTVSEVIELTEEELNDYFFRTPQKAETNKTTEQELNPLENIIALNDDGRLDIPNLHKVAAAIVKASDSINWIKLKTELRWGKKKGTIKKKK